LRLEILGGATTFATMAYIIVVNPAILSAAGIEEGPSTIATILASVFGCLLMGAYANRPLAVAPYMGENAFIAYTVALGMGVSWQICLGAVFLAGILFLILTLCKARSWLASAISPNLKHSFAIGIGLFLLFIGMFLTGIVERSAAGPPVKIGDFHDVKVQLALAGFGLMAVLMYWNVRGAMLIGIGVIAIAGYFLGVADVTDKPIDYHLEKIAFKMDVAGALQFEYLPVLLTLFLIGFLDTIGTLYALGSAANMLDDKGNIADVNRPMIVDSLACMFAAVVGTTTSGVYIESATGIREGARTGLAAVITGLLFALMLLFLPIVQPLQKLAFAYGPAMMIVGVLMFSAARKLDVEDWTELVPALVTIVMMLFTYNIANGLTAGLIVHPALKLLCWRWREIHAGSALLGAMCLMYYVFGKLH
jgi:AGZA family xanthine/uracil permease-like MFS transporter